MMLYLCRIFFRLSLQSFPLQNGLINNHDVSRQRDSSFQHDSCATSPAQADTLFHTVREAFVKMYEENDVFLNFYEDMKDAVGTQETTLPFPPPRRQVRYQKGT